MTAATGTAPAEVAAWMDAAVAGDRAAYGRLYARYEQVIFRFVHFRVGNRQLAEDLTADVFVKALARIGTFTWQGRDPGAWFVTIARNLVADHFKAAARREISVDLTPNFDSGGDLGRWVEIVDTAIDGQPEAGVLRYLDAVKVLTAVQSLTPDQRDCLVHRFLDGFSVAETAREMGKEEGAVKALQYRAVRAAAVALRTAAGPTQELPIARRVIPRPRRPMDEPPPPRAPEPDPGEGEQLMWRCRSYAQPYRTHGAPVPCGGWLEPIVGQPCPR